MRWPTDYKLGNETQKPVGDRNPGFGAKAEPQSVSCRVEWMEPPCLTHREIKGRHGVWV